MIWSLIVGALIGFIAGKITDRSSSMGIIYKTFAGLAGSYIGQAVFGDWGPHLAGMAIFPSILGAVILVAAISFFTDKHS